MSLGAAVWLFLLLFHLLQVNLTRTHSSVVLSKYIICDLRQVYHGSQALVA